MSLSYLIDERNVDAGMSPATHDLTGEWDIIKSAFDYQRKVSNFASESTLKNQVAMERNQKFEETFGVPIYKLGSGGVVDDESIDNYIMQKRNEGDENSFNIMTSTEMTDEAIKRAIDSKIEYDEASMYAEPGTWKKTAGFVGQAGGWFTDPFQGFIALASVPASAAIVASLPATVPAMAAVIGTEAAIGGVTEFVAQPSVMDWQGDIYSYAKENGMNWDEYTIEDAGKAVLMSAAGGAMFAGAVHAAASVMNFRGIHPDTMRKWMNMKPEAELRTLPPGSYDPEGHGFNMEVTAKALDEMRFPDPVEFKKSSTTKVFDSIEPEFEHAAVAKEMIEVGVKKEAENIKRTRFVDAMREEYRVLSELPRGELSALQKEADDALEAFKFARDEARNAREKYSNYEALKLESPDAVESLARLELDWKSKAASRDAAMMRHETARGALKVNKIAEDSSKVLARLEAGEIPTVLEQRFKDYSKAVDKAGKEIKKYEKSVREIANYIKKNPLTAVVKYSDSDIKKMAEPMEPEIERALERSSKAEAKAALTGDSKQKYRVVNDDGTVSEGTWDEIVKNFDDEEAALKQLEACTLGAK